MADFSQTGRTVSLQSLPGHLRYLFCSLPQQPVAAEEITALQTTDSRQRSTWRLTLADGTQLKGRILPPRTQIGFIRRIVPRLPAEQFPRIITSTSNAVLEEWFDGEPLASLPPGDERLRDCGRLLGQIHRTPCPAKSGRHNTICYQHWLESGLFRLLAENVIELPLARRVHGFATPHRPPFTDYGLTHRDFCGENLLLRNGVVCSIDNMLLSARAFDEDLARTWYRWGLSPADWQMLLAGYTELRSVESFYRHSRFWCVFVLTQTIETRLQLGDRTAADGLLHSLQTLTEQPTDAVPRFLPAA